MVLRMEVLRNMDRKLELLDAVKRVARHLGREGILVPLNVYEDEKVVIVTDKRTGSAAVGLASSEHIVLNSNDGETLETYRPGEWENYVLNVLIPQVEVIEEKKGEGKFAFEPIDDSKLFIDDSEIFNG